MPLTILDPYIPVDPKQRDRMLALVEQILSEPEPADPRLLHELSRLLPEEDGIPLETNWHRAAISLLNDALVHHLLPRDDFFIGGNMFLYYSVRQLLTEDYRGPDFFFVDGIPLRKDRPKYIVWEESGKHPDLIIELMSPSTSTVDLIDKKAIYEQKFRTRNYFCYDPDRAHLLGWELDEESERYVDVEPDDRGWLWCSVVGLWIGNWTGEYLGIAGVWPRFYNAEGKLVPTAAEAEAQRADAAEAVAAEARQRARAARQRAKAAEANAMAERQRAEAAAQRADTERERARIEAQRASEAEANAMAERQRAEELAAELARLRQMLEQRDH